MLGQLQRAPRSEHQKLLPSPSQPYMKIGLVSVVVAVFKISASLFFLIEVELIYSVVLISATQQSDSIMHIHAFFSLFFSFMVYPGDWI